MQRLVVFAGPNGSGKSTLISQMASGVSDIPVALPDRVLNPDEFARAIDPMNPDRVVVASGRAVLEQRYRLLAANVDFAIETTLSGNSEMRLLRDAKLAGYRVWLIYVSTENPKQNLMRIERRRQEQYRSVPAEDVLRRFDRSLARLSEATQISDEAYVFDNTGQDFRQVMGCKTVASRSARRTFQLGRVSRLSRNYRPFNATSINGSPPRTLNRLSFGRAGFESISYGTLL